MSDKSRFIWDGLNKQRLDKPYIRNSAGKLEETTWNSAFSAIKNQLKPDSKTLAVSGDLVSLETLYAAKKLVSSLNGKTECRIGDAYLPVGDRASYVGTTSISEIDSVDEIFLIGTNPRAEAPVLNARIRRAWLRGAQIRFVGEPVDLTYEYEYLGAKLKVLEQLDDKYFKKD